MTQNRSAIVAREALETLRSTPAGDEPLQFLAFATPLVPRSKGQLFQDLWVLWESKKRGGYFVEFGAGDGVFHSNTFLLEKGAGWSGILAEPHPAYMSSLRARRRCTISDKCVFDRSGETISFKLARLGYLSHIESVVPEFINERYAEAQRNSSTIDVHTITLNDLLTDLNAPRLIDYMSVDTEGSEYKILSAFDFDRWDVRLISVEHNFGAQRDELLHLLTSHGYRRKWEELSQWDDWYVKA